MDIYCGTDIIEVARIKKALEGKDGFVKRVFTEKEIEYCNKKTEVKYQHFAGRFAAKEATYKAISKIIGLDSGTISWLDIEIVNEVNGRPKVEIKGYETLKIDISISHVKDMATAFAVIQK